MTRTRPRTRAVPIALLVALASLLSATAVGARDGFTTTGRTVAPTGVPGASASAAPLYNARLTACKRSPRVEGRTVVVGTVIRPLANAKHLAVKVDLWQRPLGGRWTLRQDVPGLGQWTSPSDPSIGSRPSDVWRYRQAVGRLEVPDAYRFHVGFRWSDDAGNVVREANATTRACREPDLRPDLTIAGVAVHASARQSGLVRYRVTVRNDGRTPARGVSVAATLPGDSAIGQHTAQIQRAIAPGASADVTFSGPGCDAGATTPPSFQVDPANAIDESDETDNALALVCPVP